jgi:integrase
MRERQVGITGRLYAELERLRAASNGDLDARVFGIKSNVRKSFAAVCKAAEIEDGLRRHDLRHSHGSRLDALGFSLAKIGAQLGHTQLQTTLRYVNRDKAGVRQVAAALDTFNGSGSE